MATTTNEQAFTLTEERFKELSGWDFECDHTFENIIVENYIRTRKRYNTDEQWFNQEYSELRLSVSYYEIGWYKQAASTNGKLLEIWKQDYHRLLEENDRLKAELSSAQGELRASCQRYSEINDKYNNLLSKHIKLTIEADTLRDELNSIRA